MLTKTTVVETNTLPEAPIAHYVFHVWIQSITSHPEGAAAAGSGTLPAKHDEMSSRMKAQNATDTA